ncbi:MAG: Nramp family divalent metal transporter [Bryobacterales bacterium]|nr:Nramp family divalent metal transporter [Bryobacterales bacterium]MDE0295603.1 Nramp family divalent metal transporter [Bryobacterales bacterium]MDE0435287.1 Nramp family divalent metal transporter [Bryobacterales bacterium]
MFERLRTRLLLFLAVLGPGFITAVVDNDAGGIFTYSEAGARFGYNPLWTMAPVTVVLIITQVMCSRMGAVTGKGLSDLIREEFGLRMTFFVMAALLAVNLTNVTANFAGIAGSLEIFEVNRYISVPLGALAVWLLVVKGTYRSVEKIFLVASAFYVAYVISAVMIEPDWGQALESSVIPVVYFDGPYLAILIGLVGTSVAPWMQFYLQSAVVEKGIDAKQFSESRAEVIVGCIAMAFIKFFIIVCAAGAIWSVQPREIHDAAEAALALRPLGPYAYILFSAGLFNASLLAASILPLSTAYSVCEGLGFESGVNHRFGEARVFYGLYTLLIVVGAGLVLWPGFPLVRMILLSQVLNGILLPLILILILRLVNRQDLMGEWVNSKLDNILAYGTVVVMIGLSLTLVVLTVWTNRPV